MAGADTRAVVAVKVFIEEDEIAPVPVALELLGHTVDRTATLCVKARRAADILATRNDVDRKRIAFVGHSGGTIWSADGLAVDKRFKAAVFEVGLQGFTYHICTGPIPFAFGKRKELKNQLLSWVSVLTPLDAILYVGA